MAEFLMAPPEPVTWSLTVQQFAEAVARRWSEADVRGWGEGAHLAASAWIKGETSWDDILVELHANGSVIGIDAHSYDAAAEVAAWWRRTVPPDISTLWIFDRGFGGYSEVWPDTTPAEIFTARR